MDNFNLIFSSTCESCNVRILHVEPGNDSQCILCKRNLSEEGFTWAEHHRIYVQSAIHSYVNGKDEVEIMRRCHLGIEIFVESLNSTSFLTHEEKREPIDALVENICEFVHFFEDMPPSDKIQELIRYLQLLVVLLKFGEK